MRWATLILTGFLTAPAAAADLPPIDRSIKKEPAYATKSPKYCLLAVGPAAKFRAWVVIDGQTAYVDRDGSGDLTQPDKKVTAEDGDGPPRFLLGDLRDGDRVHKRLTVGVVDLAGMSPLVTNLPAVKAALAKDPAAKAYRLAIEVAGTGLTAGRVYQSAGPYDPTGVLRFADRPQDAPVVWFGGPLEVQFDGTKPTLRLARDLDLTLGVGTPGSGPGTFAEIGYDEVIPESAHPVAEFTFPPTAKGDPAVRARYELKERC